MDYIGDAVLWMNIAFEGAFSNIISQSFFFFVPLDTKPTNKMSGAASKIINYNKRLFGPGPVARVPAAGIRGFYARKEPLEGFTHAAVHGTVLGFIAAFAYKFGMGDPDAAEISAYYEENPPR